MSVIAVVGDSGSVGKTIVEALLQHGKHEAVVLSRKPLNGEKGVNILTVEYENVEANAKSLNAANIYTVICAFAMGSDEISETHVKLIKAADKSASTRRFIVSGYDMLFKEEYIPYIPTAKWAFEALGALKGTSLEHTRIVNGLFLDYYGLPHWPSHLKP